MGLDQYLYVAEERLEEDYYEHLGEPVYDENGGLAYYDDKYVIQEIAYFRKVNWLHGYLDKLCESKTGHYLGNCEYFVFSKNDLNEFLDVCREVIECESIHIAEELLPPTRGCFFGCYEVNDEYFEEVKDFIEMMEQYSEDDAQYVYWAWW